MGGGMGRPPLQFLGEDLQIKLYMNLNLHNDRCQLESWRKFITGLVCISLRLWTIDNKEETNLIGMLVE